MTAWDEILERLNEMCRCLENLEVAAEHLETAVKAAHQSFQELKPYLFQSSAN